MKIKKIAVWFFLILLIIAYGLLSQNTTPIYENTVKDDTLGEIVTAEPYWGVKAFAIVFSDNALFPPDTLAHRLATLGIAAAVVDTKFFFRASKPKTNQCHDAKHLADSVGALVKKLSLSPDMPVFISGLGDGAVIPFLNAHFESAPKINNLSIGFSIDLPTGLSLCPPYMTEPKESRLTLVAAPDVISNWRTVWSDRPPGKTGIFIKEKIPHADTNIAAYGAALDNLLLNELSSSIGLDTKPPMPIVEIPAGKTNDTVTIFYSGDGGWRDLDRSVAEMMANSNYPVLGVDVLRYFWERKTPEEVAADLIATMRYYRTKWGAKSFVLTGFSFGADILPVIYNKLPEAEKDNIKLIVFLALGNHADFEVHMAGWLGQTTRELPLAPELLKMPKSQLLCIYGKEEKEKTGTACTSLQNTETTILELPGGHHFDNDYPKLTQLILDKYRQHGIN